MRRARGKHGRLFITKWLKYIMINIYIYIYIFVNNEMNESKKEMKL